MPRPVTVPGSWEGEGRGGGRVDDGGSIGRRRGLVITYTTRAGSARLNGGRTGRMRLQQFCTHSDTEWPSRPSPSPPLFLTRFNTLPVASGTFIPNRSRKGEEEEEVDEARRGDACFPSDLISPRRNWRWLREEKRKRRGEESGGKREKVKKKPLYELSEYFRVFPSIRVKWIVFFFYF